MRVSTVRPTTAAIIASLSVAACVSPLERADQDQVLRRSVEQSIERELRSLPEAQEPRQTTQPPSDVLPTLQERREELDTLGPATGPAASAVPMGPDLLGQPQAHVQLSLRQAITTAVASNLGVQRARLQPAINEADVVRAEAAFDAVFFSNADLTWSDEPATIPVLQGIPLGTAARASERARFETGVRRRLVGGGELSISADLTRLRDNSPGNFALSPDPAYTSAVRLSLTQPLLRGFGSDVNRATIRLTRNLERRSIEDLRLELLTLVADVERAYWDLVVAWRELEIRQWLVEVGLEVRQVLERRREFDTIPAQFADAVARVEQRKSDVIRAERAVRARSDVLKRFMNDHQLTVGSEALVVPLESMVQTPLTYTLRSTMLTALQHRPEVQQAILAIDDASIRQIVADNARLPLLNLTGDLTYLGLENDPGSAYQDLAEGSFIGTGVGLTFEAPLGNRAAEAGYRRARLERSAAVIDYRRTVDDVVLDVKAALRDVITNYELIQATRSFRLAQAENLRSLLVVEENLTGLTPEFLDLKFTRQETLAAARLQEIQALSSYDKAVASLYRAMGLGLKMNQIELDLAGDRAATGRADAPDP